MNEQKLCCTYFKKNENEKQKCQIIFIIDDEGHVSRFASHSTHLKNHKSRVLNYLVGGMSRLKKNKKRDLNYLYRSEFMMVKYVSCIFSVVVFNVSLIVLHVHQHNLCFVIKICS